MEPLRLLTVCTGNVCRSPAAAVMLRAAVEEVGLTGSIEVGSAGTSWEAEGMPMDDRTELALERAGYTRPFEHVARTIHLTELLAWDLVLPMTADHAQRLRRMAEQAPEGSDVPEIRMWRLFEPGIPPGRPTDGDRRRGSLVRGPGRLRQDDPADAAQRARHHRACAGDARPAVTHGPGTA